jgi:hypothetical protein
MRMMIPVKNIDSRYSTPKVQNAKSKMQSEDRERE